MNRDPSNYINYVNYKNQIWIKGKLKYDLERRNINTTMVDEFSDVFFEEKNVKVTSQTGAGKTSYATMLINSMGCVYRYFNFNMVFPTNALRDSVTNQNPNFSKHKDHKYVEGYYKYMLLGNPEFIFSNMVSRFALGYHRPTIIDEWHNIKRNAWYFGILSFCILNSIPHVLLSATPPPLLKDMKEIYIVNTVKPVINMVTIKADIQYQNTAFKCDILKIAEDVQKKRVEANLVGTSTMLLLSSIQSKSVRENGEKIRVILGCDKIIYIDSRNPIPKNAEHEKNVLFIATESCAEGISLLDVRCIIDTAYIAFNGNVYAINEEQTKQRSGRLRDGGFYFKVEHKFPLYNLVPDKEDMLMMYARLLCAANMEHSDVYFMKLFTAFDMLSEIYIESLLTMFYKYKLDNKDRRILFNKSNLQNFYTRLIEASGFKKLAIFLDHFINCYKPKVMDFEKMKDTICINDVIKEFNSSTWSKNFTPYFKSIKHSFSESRLLGMIDESPKEVYEIINDTFGININDIFHRNGYVIYIYNIEFEWIQQLYKDKIGLAIDQHEDINDGISFFN